MKSVSFINLNPYREPRGTTPGYYYPVHVKVTRERQTLKHPGSPEKEKEEPSAHMITQSHHDPAGSLTPKTSKSTLSSSSISN